MTTPGRLGDFQSSEVDFVYSPPQIVTTPEVYPTPTKIKTRNPSEWQRNKRVCTIACDECGPGPVQHDIPLANPLVASTCSRGCKRGCNKTWTFASRKKIRTLRHEVYSKGVSNPNPNPNPNPTLSSHCTHCICPLQVVSRVFDSC